MKTLLIAVGKVKEPFAEADAHYRKLLSRQQPVEVVEVRDELNIEGRLPSPAHVVALDHGGRALNSIAWSRLAGGEADRRDRSLLCDRRPARALPPRCSPSPTSAISLGPQTMAHQLARVVLLEQLFRATKILAGEPYHY